MVQKTHSKISLQKRRQLLRTRLTPAETQLWKYLKGKQLMGKRFTKQHSIKNYIVDFYYPSESLIIELDGEVHNNPAQMEYDSIRTTILEGLGYTIIRFENKAVFDYLPFVLDEISRNFKSG